MVKMVLITIVTGAYKPTNITGGHHFVGTFNTSQGCGFPTLRHDRRRREEAQGAPGAPSTRPLPPLDPASRGGAGGWRSGVSSVGGDNSLEMEVFQSESSPEMEFLIEKSMKIMYRWMFEFNCNALLAEGINPGWVRIRIPQNAVMWWWSATKMLPPKINSPVFIRVGITYNYSIGSTGSWSWSWSWSSSSPSSPSPSQMAWNEGHTQFSLGWKHH